MEELQRNMKGAQEHVAVAMATLTVLQLPGLHLCPEQKHA